MDIMRALGASLTAAVAIDRGAELAAEAEQERLRRIAIGSTPRRSTPAQRSPLPPDGRLASWASLLVAGIGFARHEA